MTTLLTGSDVRTSPPLQRWDDTRRYEEGPGEEVLGVRSGTGGRGRGRGGVRGVIFLRGSIRFRGPLTP